MNFKKFISSISALAIATSAFAGMAVTVNAAVGDVTTNASADFASDLGDFNIVSSNSSSKLELSTKNSGWLAVGKGSGTVTIADDALAGAYDVVTVEFKVAYGKLGNRSVYYNIADSKGTKIVDWDYNVYSDKINTNVLGSGVDLPSSSEFYHGSNEPNVGRAASYVFTFDFVRRTVTQSTTNLENKTTTTHTNQLPDGVNDVKTLTIGSNYDNTSRRCEVDDILIKTTEGDSSLTKYTISYKLDGQENAVYKTWNAAESGATATAASSFKANNGDKYIVDNPQTFTVGESGNDFVQTCRAAKVYSVDVNAKGDISKNIFSGTVVEGENSSYVFPQYIVENGTAYEATPFESTYYGGTVTNASKNETIEVTYKTKYTNVVAYDELDGSNDKNAGVRASNCSAYNGQEYKSAELQPGTYKAVVRWAPIGRGSKMTIGNTILIDGTNLKTEENPNGFDKNSWLTTTTAEFTIDEAASLVWNKGASACDPIDTVLIIEVPPTHTESFTFDKKLSELNTDPDVTVTFKNDSTGNTSALTEKLGSTFDGQGNAKIAVVVTNIAKGYSVQSITIE